MNHNVSLECYKGRSLIRPFGMEAEGTGEMTARMRVWPITDEPIADDYTFPINKDLQYDPTSGEGLIALTPEETGALISGVIYRWRIEAVFGDDVTPTLGGRLYVGVPYGQ